jgi:hypothetical protein
MNNHFSGLCVSLSLLSIFLTFKKRGWVIGCPLGSIFIRVGKSTKLFCSVQILRVFGQFVHVQEGVSEGEVRKEAIKENGEEEHERDTGKE